MSNEKNLKRKGLANAISNSSPDADYYNIEFISWLQEQEIDIQKLSDSDRRLWRTKYKIDQQIKQRKTKE